MGMFTHKDGAPQQSGGGLFGGGQAQQAAPALPPEVLTLIREGSRRIRVLEERLVRQRKTMQVNEQDFLTKYKKTTNTTKSLTQEIDDLKKDFKTMNEKITMLIAELQQFAKKDEVAVLQKYVNLWEPIQFVTRKELDRVLNERSPKKSAVKKEK